MILFITKKATVIYKLISSLLFIVISFKSFASEDLASFCFEPRVNLGEAKSSLSFLLLPKEQVFMRPADHCMDVTVISPDRTKLLEKFLSKRYTLVGEKGVSSVNSESPGECQIELKSSRKKKIDGTKLRVGSFGQARIETNDLSDVSTSSLLLSYGKPGLLDVDGKALYIECVRGASGVYQLTFSYSEEYRARVNSSVSAKQNEVVSIAEITRDLNEKSKILGLPESSYIEQKGQEVVKYELQIK